MPSPTYADADAILAFLPGLEQPGRSYYAPVVSTAHYPIYADDVAEFFLTLGSSGWMDTAYEPWVAARMAEDPTAIASASVAELCVLLTWCVRSERFADGAWGSLLQRGKVQAMLHRVAAVRDSLTD